MTEGLMDEGLRLRRHDAQQAREVFGALGLLYADVYADMLAQPFRSVSRFRERLEEYAGEPRFELVTAQVGDAIVGYALGYSLAPDTEWWARVQPPLPADFTRESAEGRTFVLEELMVRTPWRRRGIARALCREILSGRPEERATLLIRPGNDVAQAIAARWNWRKVGDQRPAADAPVFNTFVRELHA
jgi:ribosomal protein S18 acetylase RimI-like enzyme